MRIRQGEWAGGELCSMLHRKGFMKALAALEAQLCDQKDRRLLFEIREVKRKVIRARAADWLQVLIDQAGEDWISSVLRKLPHPKGTGRWSSLKRGNGTQAIEYELEAM